MRAVLARAALPLMLLCAPLIAAADRLTPPTPTPVTIAALPAKVTAGRGARVSFVECEAENAATNGVIIGPDQRFGELASEASGRRAVRLNQVGAYVEFTLARPANAVTVRYALPDSSDGAGLDGEIAVLADGARMGVMHLTSRYGWFYGRYPFTNAPKDGGAHHFYDEARLMFGRTLPAGTRVRFTVEHADAAAWRVIDLADFEEVAPPLKPPVGAISVEAYGADSTGGRDSRRAIQAALIEGKRSGRTVWLDPGVYRVDGHLSVDSVTLAGAGPWYSTLTGEGVGVFGAANAQGVVLRDFAVLGEVTERDDHAHLSAIGGNMSDSVVSNLWLQHAKGGLWFDGPMTGITVKGLRILDQTADGLNFHRGVTGALVEDVFVRNSGDDGLASWSQPQVNSRIVFRHNTVIAPILANGIALYGGRDAEVSDNLIADTVEGGGLHLGARFKATPFAGSINVERNTVVRGGGLDRNWNDGIGAFWIYALDRPVVGADIRVRDIDLIDSSFEAIQFIGKPISGVSFDHVTIDKAGGSAVQLQAPGRARFTHVTAWGLGAAGVRDCGSGFEIKRGEEDSGWETMAGCTAKR